MRVRDLTRQMRWHVFYNSIAMPTIFLAILWSMYAVEHYWDVDIRAFFRHAEPMPRAERDAIAWYLATTATPIMIVWAAVNIRRTLRLAMYGVEVVPKIVKVRGVGTLSSRIDCEYEFRGKTYRKALGLPRIVVDMYLDGSLPLVLVIDPQRPQRAMERSDVLPASSQPQSELT